MNKLISILFVLGSVLLPASGQIAAQRGRSITIRRIGPRGWMGLGIGDLTPERAKAFKLASEAGVEVFNVEENSPAAKAGVRTGDVILEIDGQKIQDGEQFARTIGESAPGVKLTLTVWRNAAKLNLAAVLEARPMQFYSFQPLPPFPAAPPDAFSAIPLESPRVGFEGESLTPQLAQYFGVKDGVLVRSVVPQSPAEKAGLKAGDIIMKVGGTPVTSTREISGLVRSSHKTASFTVMRNRKELVLNVELALNVRPPDEDVTLAAACQMLLAAVEAIDRI